MQLDASNGSQDVSAARCAHAMHTASGWLNGRPRIPSGAKIAGLPHESQTLAAESFDLGAPGAAQNQDLGGFNHDRFDLPDLRFLLSSSIVRPPGNDSQIRSRLAQRMSPDA